MNRLAVTASLLLCLAGTAFAGPEDDVKATFQKFVVAQNAHDLKAVGGLLWDSPDFLWITRTAPLWGHDAAFKRFEMLYQGTWRMEPEGSLVKVVLLGEGAAQVYAPITFTVGAKGQPVQTARYMFNQMYVKTKDGWKVSSMVPVPVPAQ